MIGPMIESFRTGQRVQIVDKAHADFGAIGYIVGISAGTPPTFQVDIGEAKRSTRPMVRLVAAAQLRST